MLIPVVPAKVGTQGFQTLAPCSSQGQAPCSLPGASLGPRVRGDDEFVRPEDILRAAFAGTTKIGG
jgi:hypothetical protein